MEKLNINQLAEEDRPLEKFMTLGAEALSKAELLAILIGSGNPQENAVTLMQRILNEHGGNLKTLGRMTIHDLMAYNGIGEAKAISILAACELGKRRQAEDVLLRPAFTSAQDIYDLMRNELEDKDIEQAWVMLLNQKFKLITKIRISTGGISETAVDVRQIMKHAVLNNATVLALIHNHPSGDPSPSRDDDNITQRLKKACEIMRIYLLDHVIVGDSKYYSYHEQGRL